VSCAMCVECQSCFTCQGACYECQVCYECQSGIAAERRTASQPQSVQGQAQRPFVELDPDVIAQFVAEAVRKALAEFIQSRLQCSQCARQPQQADLPFGGTGRFRRITLRKE